MESSISPCPSTRLRPFLGAADAFSSAMLRRSASMRLTTFCGRGAACSRDTGKPASFFLSISTDRKSTRLNSSHLGISYAVFCLLTTKHVNRLHLHVDKVDRSASTLLFHKFL